ncbi:MAG: RNA-dependent DNA polymerase, partial [Weeksellaceae bacterium]
MEKILFEDIERQAIQIKERFELYHNNIERWHQRISSIYTNPPNKIISVPAEWDEDQKFNPYYVLKRNAQISKS